MSDDFDSRNNLLAQRDAADEEIAELRAELLSRAQKDAEDTHRLQSAYDALHAEAALMQAQLADVMRAGDLEHARMAALIEACEAVAAFVESYGPQSPVAQVLPTFYANLRVYGKNARAAVNAVRTQADAMVARLADLSRQIGEQHTTIGYQDAMLSEMRTMLDAAYHGLMSYACGNSAPALAEEMAAEIARVLGKASME